MNIKTNGGKYIYGDAHSRSSRSQLCCIILEKGDLFWSTTFVEIRRSWHFISRHVRPFRSLLFDAALPFRSGAPARSLGRPRAGLQSVGRARSSVRDVCARRVPFVSFHNPEPFNRECEREGTPRREETVVEREGTMAVSQPRPPDRVDAALEKVAPLRYLKAHECARSARTVTRYYHKPLS